MKLLYEDNTLLDEENKRLLKRYQEDKIQHSGDKQANGGSAAKVRHLLYSEALLFCCLVEVHQLMYNLVPFLSLVFKRLKYHFGPSNLL